MLRAVSRWVEVGLEHGRGGIEEQDMAAPYDTRTTGILNVNPPDRLPTQLRRFRPS